MANHESQSESQAGQGGRKRPAIGGCVKSPDLAESFADVNVVPRGDGHNRITVCVKPDPNSLIGEKVSRAVVGLDASKSIKPWYGRKTIFGPDEPNRMAPIARKLGETLCGVTKGGQTRFFYWAMGDGSDIEDIGTFKSSELTEMRIDGVDGHKWGVDTHLLPAIKTIVEGGSEGGGDEGVMGVMLTDGIIEDETECIEYCMGLGTWLVEHPEVTIKLIIIGVGDQVDASQLARFDDMFEGTELEDKVDFWSCCPTDDIEDEKEILDVLFSQLMTEDVIVAPSGKVLDPDGNVVKQFADGLPDRFIFMLPEDCSSFTLQAGGQEHVQDLSDVLAEIAKRR